MDFQFAPWERLTSDVADGAANFSFDEVGRRPDWLAPGEACQFLVRRCGPLVWLRERNRPPLEWNLWFFCPPVASNDRPTAEYRANFVYMLDPARVDDFVHRLWILSAQPLFVVTWNCKAGWRFHTQFNAQFSDEFGQPAPKSSWEFLPEIANPQQKPSSESFSLLQTDWKNAQSDLRQTLHFAECYATLGELEQDLLCVQTRIETPQRFVSLARAALRCFDAKWFEDGGIQIFCQARDDEYFKFDLRGEYGLRFGPYERSLLQVIERTFAPRLRNDDGEQSSGLRTLVANRWARNFFVAVSPPSTHEQLEAALELRAWLQVHWPDGVKHLSKIV